MGKLIEWYPTQRVYNGMQMVGIKVEATNEDNEDKEMEDLKEEKGT